MADILLIFAVIASIIFIGFIAEFLFKLSRIPDVIILIGIGIIISKGLGWVNKDSFGDGAVLFSTFALVYLLFQGSLNIEFKTLFKSWKSTTTLTFLSFFFTAIIIALISHFILNYDFKTGLLLGATLGGVSSSVVIPILKMVPISKKYASVLTLESAISDVLSIVGAITLITIINTGNIEVSGIVSSIITSFGLSIFLGILAGLVWVYLLSKSELMQNSYMITVAALMGLYAFVESPFVGSSGAIAALSFGLILGNSKFLLKLKTNKNNSKSVSSKSSKSKQSTDASPPSKSILSTSAKNFYSEISFFVKVFFYVYLGILIDFSNPSIYLAGAAITVGIFLIRPLVVKLSFLRNPPDDDSRTVLEILIPKGLAASVIAQFAVNAGVPGGEMLLATVLSVILISIILSSILVFLSGKDFFYGIYSWKKPKS